MAIVAIAIHSAVVSHSISDHDGDDTVRMQPQELGEDQGTRRRRAALEAILPTGCFPRSSLFAPTRGERGREEEEEEATREGERANQHRKPVQRLLPKQRSQATCGRHHCNRLLASKSVRHYQ